VAGTNWTWPKIDDKLTKLEEFIRRVNLAMKKLENSFGIVTTTVQAVGTFTNGSVQPNVSQASVWKTNNTAATSITNFIGADAGKTFTLIAGDGNTTVKNNANIVTKTGADRVLGAGAVLQFVTFDGAVWREYPT
jgi:hypothetical protein